MTFQQANTITFSIVSHGHGAMLHALLDDIANFKNASNYELIVTLNISSETLDLQRWPALRIHIIRNNSPKGFGANHNQAFELCTTSWFVVLNPDLRMPIDPMPFLIYEVNRHDKKIGVVAPLVVNELGYREDHVRRNLTPWSLLRRYTGSAADKIDVSNTSCLENEFYWLAGMFLAFSSDAYRHVKGFDERFFLYCEDYDICVRLVLAKWHLLIVNEVQVIHAAQRDSHRSWRHLRWHLKSLLVSWTSISYWHLLILVMQYRCNKLLKHI